MANDSYFRFDDDNEMKYKYSHCNHKKKWINWERNMALNIS